MSQDAHHPTGGDAAGLPGEPWSMIDAYLDGMLEGDDLARFERAMAEDPSLQAEIEAQRRIDTSLTRLYQHADPIKLPPESVQTAPSLRLTEEPAHAAAAPAAKKQNFLTRPFSPLMSVAASLLIVGLISLFVTGVIDPGAWFSNKGLVSPESVYQSKVATGFIPDWVCTTDQQFVENTRDLLDEPFLIRSTGSVEVVGWAYYSPVLSRKTIILLTRVEGKEVIVVMDHKENDRRLRLPRTTGLHDFSEVVGNAVLHEITPFDAPRVLPLVERVSVPAGEDGVK